MTLLKYLSIVFALMVSVYSWSDDQAVQNSSKDTKKDSYEYQLGTDNQPIFISGEITTHQNKDDADKEEADREQRRITEKEQIRIDDSIAEYTRLNMYVTGIIALIAFAQIILFWCQLRLMNITAKDGTATTKLLVATERPWLFIESVHVVRREGAPIQPDIINNWYIGFRWKNVGRSPAIIKECIFKIQDKDTLLETPDYSNHGFLNCAQTIGADKIFETSQAGPSHDIRTKNNNEAIIFVVYGRLTYKDVGGGEHKTGFAVEVSPHLPNATTYDNKAYEYYD